MPTLVNGRWVSTTKSGTQDISKLLEQITGKTSRLNTADLGIDTTTTEPDIGMFSKAMNVLSSGQKVAAKTARDVLMEGMLPTMQEYKTMLDPKTSYSYTKLLEEMGMQPGFARSALGLGLDIFGDPLTYVPLGAVGKVAGKVAKPLVEAGKELPLLGKGISHADEAVRGLATWAKQARGITPFESKGLNEVWQMLNGVSSRMGQVNEEVLAKYPEVFKGIENISPDRYKTILQAAETADDKLPEIMKALKPEEATWLTDFRRYIKDTGEEKKMMGVVKELIGQVPETQDLSLLSDNMAESIAYNAHILTKEGRDYFGKLSGDPNELKQVMAGMIRKNLPTMEKKRTIFGTINDINQKWMSDKGFKLFEDNPAKILNNYQLSFAKRKALWGMNQDIMKVVDDAGMPLIKPMGKEATEGMVKLTGIPYKGEYEAAPEVAKMINRVNGVFASDEMTNKFLQGYDKVLRAFKFGVTMPWPTFNLNNLMGAMFNNFIFSSTSMKDLPEAIAMMKGKPMLITAKNGATITGKEMMEQLAKRGALNTFTKVETGLEGLSKITDNLLSNKLVKGYAENLPNNIERMVRTNLAIDTFKKTGSIQEAARAVWQVHGNYTPEFLSGFEKNVMARVFPFWRWMRTSIPFQLENLYNQTGKYAALAKTQNAIVSPEQRANLPEYLKNEALFGVLGKGDKQTALAAQLPIQDILQFLPQKQGESVAGRIPKALLSRIAPMMKVPLEVGFNKELYSGKDIVNEKLPAEMQTATVPSFYNKIPILKQLLGVKEYDKLNKRTGETEKVTEANARANYILNNLGPITSLSAVGKRAARASEAQGPDANNILASLIGLLSPVKVYPSDKQEVSYQQAQAQNARLQEIINYLLQRNMIERLK
jgi:hypothetical protein